MSTAHFQIFNGLEIKSFGDMIHTSGQIVKLKRIGVQVVHFVKIVLVLFGKEGV